MTATVSRLYNRAEKQLLPRRGCASESTLFYADMAELADAAVLGAAGRPCRFESCYPHALTLVEPRVFFLFKRHTFRRAVSVFFLNSMPASTNHNRPKLLPWKSVPLKIPTPKFLVFYTGINAQPERRLLKLSDSFEKDTDDPKLELKVLQLNINDGKSKELMERCRRSICGCFRDF